jgi:hypothetical protein
MSSDAWTTLAATIVGGVLTIAGGFAAEWYRHFREAAAIKAALCAEARAALEWFKSDELERNIEAVIRRIQSTNQIGDFGIGSSRGSYDTVFSGCASKLGLLDRDLTDTIVAFYYSVREVIEHFDVLESGRRDPDSPIWLPSYHLQIEQELLAKVKQAHTLGCEVINRLDPPL